MLIVPVGGDVATLLAPLDLAFRRGDDEKPPADGEAPNPEEKSPMTNPVADLTASFQDVVNQVPDLVQPLIVGAAGMIPFIEGEVASVIGIVGGLNPVVAGVAGGIGNLLCVTLLVLLSSGVRSAVTGRSGRSRELSPRKAKFQKAFERFGVPGVSLLGPALLPTMFTATALVGAGVARGRVLAWQAVAIALWTTGVTLIATGAISAVG